MTTNLLQYNLKRKDEVRKFHNKYVKKKKMGKKSRKKLGWKKFDE